MILYPSHSFTTESSPAKSPFMQDVTRHIPAVIYEYSIFPGGEQRFTYVSESSASVLGLDATAIVRDRNVLFSAIDPDDLPMLMSLMESETDPSRTLYWKGRIVVGGTSRRIVFRFNGDRDDGGVRHQRGIIEVATQYDETTFERAGDYESLLEKLPVGVVIHVRGDVIFANAHAHQMVAARQPGQMIGKKVLGFVHPDDQPEISNRIRYVEQGNSAPMVELRLIRFDGKVIDVESMAYPFSYNGEFAIQIVFREITERKNVEVASRKNETLFTQLFHNIPFAVVMLEDTGKVFEVNSSFEQMFGYERQELKGKNLNDFIVPEDLRNEGIDLNNLIAAKKVISMESIRKHRSGKQINVILCGFPVIMDNQTIGIYGVYIDISDRKRVEEELKIRNAELDNFVYKVSHDLRAPLSSVLGLVNLSRLEGNTDNPLEYMKIIGEKIDALDHFISDVLSHSKNLKMEVNIEHVDLHRIIDQTFKDLGYLAGARNMKRTIKIDGIDFFSDPWRISEIFRNLISNAIKYRKADVDHPEIGIRVVVDHLCADISFVDNGIGIKESSLKRIFEMFYRATDQSDGSGIGLYIVKNAVEKLGGQITVASKVGHGTRFHILVPNRINSALKAPILSDSR